MYSYKDHKQSLPSQQLSSLFFLQQQEQKNGQQKLYRQGQFSMVQSHYKTWCEVTFAKIQTVFELGYHYKQRHFKHGFYPHNPLHLLTVIKLTLHFHSQTRHKSNMHNTQKKKQRERSMSSAITRISIFAQPAYCTDIQ